MKKCIFWLVTGFLIWISIEGLAFIGYAFMNGEMYSPLKAAEKIKAIYSNQHDIFRLSEPQPAWPSNEIGVIHPYVGFVFDPNKSPGISNLGFPCGRNPDQIRKKSRDTLIVAIFGGSFAQGLVANSFDVMERMFKSSGKEPVILNFANGGYKQPQQLMILSYLLSLGAEFDIVINIDGFNEVALPVYENVNFGVSPYYPRLWLNRTGQWNDLQKLRQHGYIAFLQEKKAKWTDIFYRNRWSLSPACTVVWQLRDRIMARQIFQLQKDIHNDSKYTSTTMPYAVSGPQFNYDNERTLYTKLAEMWYRSSLQMKALCDGNNIRYLHFLQPNQYVAGSKPMNSEEIKIALSINQPYRIGVLQGYPLLEQAGLKLIEMGVHFTDLTRIFLHNDEVLYSDNCCHLGKKGYDLIIQRIAAEIPSTEE
jgi:hypothetical protein